MTKANKTKYARRAILFSLTALLLLGVDLDVDVTINPLFGLLG
jgi:hypothetical protein